MATEQGWWKLIVSPVVLQQNGNLSDTDLQHIAKLIADGYTEGEITKDEETQ